MKDWIHILRCPISHEELRLMEQPEFAVLLEAKPELRFIIPGNFGASDNIQQALTNISNRYLYPVIDGIPILLTQAVFDLSLLAKKSSDLNAGKKKVLDFYNARGWMSSSGGDYEDAIIYEDLRPVSKDYILSCHQRVSRHLPLNGKFLLDAASGPVQFDIYLSYSENFQYHICVDFSLLALKAAKKKLGAKGIYILCDITNLPLKDSIIDAFISLNTIYHIPADEQVKAVKELHRSLIDNGKGVLVYDWFQRSFWMNIALLPFRAFVFLKNRILSALNKMAGNKTGGNRLYFFAHKLEYFRQHLPPFKLFVWRTVSVPFLKYYVHSGLFGKSFLSRLYRYEEKHPERCGKNGEYPMMVFKKKTSSIL